MSINPSSLIKNPLFQAIADGLPEILVILDDQFKVALLNDSAEKLLHCPLIEAYGKPFSEICHQAHFAFFISDYIKTHANNTLNQEITTLIDNTKLTWRAFSIETPEGLFHVLKTINFSDKENKNAIFHLETLIENMPCNVYWVDKNCLMLGCNQNVLTMLNMTMEQFLGKSYEELAFLCNWPEGLASKLKNDDLTVLHSGKGIYGIEDPPIPHSNNTFLHLLTSRVPLRNKNGEIIGVAGISTDITALKEAKEKLEAASRANIQNLADLNTLITGQAQDSSSSAEEYAQEICAFYQSIIANMPDHVYWLDRKCVLRGGNNELAHFFGLKSASELAGLTYEEMSKLANWTEGQGQSFKDAELEAMSTGVPRLNVEEPVVFVDGQPKYYISNKVPLYNNKGKIIGVLGITTDVTDLKEAKEKAEAASRAKSEFIANMSHDFVTPLTGIINMSSDLMDEQSTPDNQQRAQWLNKSGERLLELCTGILQSVSADKYTEQVLNEECFDLHQFIDAIEKLEKPMIQSKKLEFKVDIAKSIPPYLITDRVKLHRVLLNLLGNAIKFTQTGYVGVKIKLLKKNKKKVTLAISVVDTGRGIAPDLQEKIFERFFRVNPSYRAIDKGYGIGLHIAQKYVHLLGGEEGIQLESKEGKGSRFYFVLSFKIGNAKDAVQIVPEQEQSIEVIKKPNDMKTEETQPPSSLQQKDTLLSNSPLLLLIEDTPPALLGLESIVKKAGCRFKSAIDGETGLELAKNNDFDLIITDIGLPGISGIEVSKQIRDWEKANHRKKVPIVALTAHATRMAEPECLEAGIDKVFTKPASIAMLKNLIQQFISKNDIDSNVAQQSMLSKKDISTPPKTGLGPDLPDTEEELFMLDQYPYLDMKVLKEIYGDDYYSIIGESLESMPSQIIKDKKEIMDAFIAKDWDKVEKLAHRAKGGALSCGTLRMKYACQYLERCRKAGHSKSLEKLYYQLMQVLDETKAYIEKWLKMSREV
ncbi:PAS domain-containing protein [Legionella sp.]|uniref:PAS domain-containing protein n=1 Tax=Legionella sp. TaxID=459 RepID=UPI003C8D2A99